MSEARLQEYVAALQDAVDRNLVLLTEEDMDFFHAVADGGVMTGSANTKSQEVRRRYARSSDV